MTGCNAPPSLPPQRHGHHQEAFEDDTVSITLKVEVRLKFIGAEWIRGGGAAQTIGVIGIASIPLGITRAKARSSLVQPVPSCSLLMPT